MVVVEVGDPLSLRPCRLDDPADCEAVIELALGTYGRIDALCNIAATAYFNWLEDITDEEWDRARWGEVDLVFYLTRAAWPHLKANGGVFLVDDFGRERVTPEQLLNRFITPMEYQLDYFTLRTGQKIQLPLRHVLIVATNLSPEKVTDPAFLRRLGYRLFLGPPGPEAYARIFQEYAQRHGATVAPDVIARLLKRITDHGREGPASVPRAQPLPIGCGSCGTSASISSAAAKAAAASPCTMAVIATQVSAWKRSAGASSSRKIAADSSMRWRSRAWSPSKPW